MLNIINTQKSLEKLNKRSLSIVIFFLLLTLSILTIADGDYFFSLSLHKYPALNTIISMLIIIIGAILLHKRSWKIDGIVILLFTRLCFAIITMLSMSNSIYSSIKAICVFITSILTYYIFMNKSKDIDSHRFTSLIAFYLFILSIQTLGIYFLNYINYSILAKNLIEIPIGRSNLIATHVLVCVVFIYYSKNRSKFQSFTLALGIITLLLTLSFGAIISLVSVVLIKVVFMYSKSGIKKMLVLFLIIIILLYLILIYFPNYSYSGDSIISNLNRNISTKIIYFLDGNYERLFSDRFVLYDEAWSKFINNPLFGSFEGLSFRNSMNFRAHNLFLEALSSYGVFGFVTLLLPLIIIFKRISIYLKKDKQDIKLIPCFLALLAGVIHGLVEPNFFSLEFEFLWWAIAGFSISNVSLKKYTLKSM